MSKIPLVEGIRENTEVGKAVSGLLELPRQFDRSQNAAKWVEQGLQTEQAMQDQPLGSRHMAPGWQVWKNAGKPCIRVLSNKRYILMFRPKALQKVINATFGNLSREKIQGEYKGEERTNPETGQVLPPEPGILTSSILDQIERTKTENLPAHLRMNVIEPQTAQASSKPKKTFKLAK